MSKTAEKSDPKLWDKVKRRVTRGDKGGKPGTWSARKAQLAVQEYKAEGGGYRGPKTGDNHLKQWQDEEWGTKSGKRSADTGERYLPKAARDRLSAEEYRRTTAKKRTDTKRGKQFSRQPKDVARKAADARKEPSKAELYERAKKRNIPGRSKMSKSELMKALSAAK